MPSPRHKRRRSPSEPTYKTIYSGPSPPRPSYSPEFSPPRPSYSPESDEPDLTDKPLKQLRYMEDFLERVVVNLEQISKEDSRDFRKKLKHVHGWEDDTDYFGGDDDLLERYGKLRKNVDNLRSYHDHRYDTKPRRGQRSQEVDTYLKWVKKQSHAQRHDYVSEVHRIRDILTGKPPERQRGRKLPPTPGDINLDDTSLHPTRAYFATDLEAAIIREIQKPNDDYTERDKINIFLSEVGLKHNIGEHLDATTVAGKCRDWSRTRDWYTNGYAICLPRPVV